MKREKEESMKSGKGNVSFFFYDLSNMSTTASLLYVCGIIGFFTLIFYLLGRKLLEKPVDFTK